ncbi:MAG: hypothetical protein ACKVVP_25150 [Chloroflexota bacterium]
MGTVLTFNHIELLLLAIVIALLGSIRLVMLAEQQLPGQGAAACARCGETAALVDDRLERPHFGGLTIIERYLCSWCGHEQLRVLNAADSLDGT